MSNKNCEMVVFSAHGWLDWRRLGGISKSLKLQFLRSLKVVYSGCLLTLFIFSGPVSTPHPPSFPLFGNCICMTLFEGIGIVPFNLISLYSIFYYFLCIFECYLHVDEFSSNPKTNT